MMVLTLDQVDREISERTVELEALATALVELDSHPGIEHVRRYPPTGITADRWVAVESAFGQMWDGLRSMTSILDAVHAVRARCSKPDEAAVDELTRLLHERPLAVSPDGDSLDRPVVGGVGQAVERIGLVDTAGRIRAAYPAVAEFLAAVDNIGGQIANGLAPCIRRLDELGATAPEELTELLAASATDPLSFTADDVRERLEAIARNIELQAAQCAEDAALRANWAESIAVTGDQIDMLREVLQRAENTRAHAERRVVTSPLPVPLDPEPEFRDRLRSLTEPDPSALRSLREHIAAAVRDARECERLARGLLDRRAELSGRLKAYQAKAARLGIGEDRDLLAANAMAEGLLAHRPCDLRAATRAVNDYQELVARSRGAP